MMRSIRNSTIPVALAIILLTFSFGCKSKKKAMEAEAAKEKARTEEAALKKQEEEARKKEAEAKAREAEAERLRNESAANTTKESAPAAKLSQYFQSISTAPNVASANNSINEALTMFASPDAPVLIVISEENGKKDYDRPTTIRDYLNYLKDQKKNMNSIASVKVDGAGKITEVELKKPL